MSNSAHFFESCERGDVSGLRGLLASEPTLARLENPAAPHAGWTGLHTAAQHGHADAVRLLIGRGADPNAREAGDNTYPLHWAAAGRHTDAVRTLLDAGGDVHGLGDMHQMDVIGWATIFLPPDGGPAPESDVVQLLLERGARHHIFSAIAAGDLDVIQELVRENPTALDRRMSRFEQDQTPLQFAMNRKRYDILDLLIQLGADLEAAGANGHTALETAMLSGDREAMRRLLAAGAKQPAGVDTSGFQGSMAKLAGSTYQGVPMIRVPDVGRTLDWYTSIGFKELGRYEDGVKVNWGMLSFGKAKLMLTVGGKAGAHDVSLWFYTNEIHPLYELLKSRQYEAAQAAKPGIEFVEHLYEPPYGGLEFGIRDLNGYDLFFLQED